MITILIGNLFNSKCQTLVNTVNCVGIMGKGIALEFKKRFPAMFIDYQKKCKSQEVILGRPYLYKGKEEIKQSTFFDFESKENKLNSSVNHWILNFPTKDHWRSTTSLNDIIIGIEYLLKHYKKWGIESMAIPPLGCGQGQLEWRIVGPTLYRYLDKLDIPIEFYAPYNTPHEELQPEFLGKPINPMPNPKWIPAAWIILVEIIKRINDQPYHWPIGKTIFQKICYVATESKITTNLTFKKASYGPFSDILQKDILVRLINNGLLKEERLGKMQSLKPGNTFSDARKAYIKEIELSDKIINRIVDLFLRINGTEQAEIVATVMYAVKDLKNRLNTIPTEKNVLEYVVDWKKDMDQLKVEKAIRNLAMLSWIEVKASPEIQFD